LREERAVRKREQAWAARYTAPDCECRRHALLARFEETAETSCNACDRCTSAYSAALERVSAQTEAETLLILKARTLPWSRRSLVFQGVRGARLAALSRFLR
jgi:superfamily II DNA helicase RecQ